MHLDLAADWLLAAAALLPATTEVGRTPPASARPSHLRLCLCLRLRLRMCLRPVLPAAGSGSRGQVYRDARFPSWTSLSLRSSSWVDRPQTRRQ